MKVVDHSLTAYIDRRWPKSEINPITEALTVMERRALLWHIVNANRTSMCIYLGGESGFDWEDLRFLGLCVKSEIRRRDGDVISLSYKLTLPENACQVINDDGQFVRNGVWEDKI